ncbi:MAG: HTTM domain-containing protein, partial [Acidimicrobiales bacterium]|nr:HTTM domain-containing protein [Acidimicrobiales bacterium]
MTAALAPVDGASLAVVRMAVGAVVVLAAGRTWANGWTDSLYAGPTHRFTYLGLGWVPQPGPLGIRLLVAATAAAGLALALGWRTRLAALSLVVAWGWIEAIDATTYLNHYWFVTLLALLAVAVPFGQTWSIDARRRTRVASPAPATVAAGWVWLLRAQVGVVYAFAGLAKLQVDWLVRAEPLRFWLPARRDLPLVGSLLAAPETAHVAAVAGAAFDCLVVPALLWRRTRPWAYLALVAFHLVTWSLFPIGVFPWLMAACATVFFEPDWPRRAIARVASRVGPDRQIGTGPAPDTAAPVAPGGAAGAAARGDGRRPRLAGVAVAVGVAWVAIQVALPLRHLAYPGDHRWTGEGYRFGWNVLLTERVGSVAFRVRDPATGRTWTADPTELYTPTQLRVMPAEADLVHQAARTVADHEADLGHPDVEVRVDAWLSVNGRPPARWIDPAVDLAAQPRRLGHQPWL